MSPESFKSRHVTPKQEQGAEAPLEHLRSLALSAIASSALLMAAPAHAEKYEHVPALSAKNLEVLRHIGLENLAKDKDIQIRIPRTSSSGKYIVQIDVEHLNRNADRDSKEQRVIQTQKQSYDAIRAIVADLPYAAFYPEGASKEKGAAGWDAEKRAVQKFKIEMLRLQTEGHLNLDTVKSSFKQAVSDYQVTSVMSSELTRTLAATGLESLAQIKGDLAVTNYLQAFAPLGKDTVYYYGGLKHAYEQGYVQNVKGCESLEELEAIDKQMKEDPNAKIDHSRREQKLVECLAADIQAPGEDFVVTTFGASHDFGNEIDTFNKAKKSDIKNDVGYIVLTPNALSWYVESSKDKK